MIAFCVMADHAEQDWPDQLAEVVAHDHDHPGLTPAQAATAFLALLDGMQQQWLLDQDQTDGHPDTMRAALSALLGIPGDR